MNSVTCQLMGGLGNQLFQIFTVINYAFKYNHNFTFTSAKSLNIGRTRETYWDNFLHALKPHTSSINIKNYYREPYFKYKEIPEIRNDICLLGYFQSYKYFKEHFQDICCYLEIEVKPVSEDKDISIHFRIDDYTRSNGIHPILPLEYYIRALETIIQKDNKAKNVTVFYQPCDRDIVNSNITTLKKKFPTLIFTMVNEKLCDWEQLLDMSQHRHKVIANSTFSWWAAYLNQVGITCYPAVWFGGQLSEQNIDLCPDDWIKIPIQSE